VSPSPSLPLPPPPPWLTRSLPLAKDGEREGAGAGEGGPGPRGDAGGAHQPGRREHGGGGLPARPQAARRGGQRGRGGGPRGRALRARPLRRGLGAPRHPRLRYVPHAAYAQPAPTTTKNQKILAEDSPTNRFDAKGTWRTHAVCSENDVLKVRKDIKPEYAATIAVNPCTALRLLEDFVSLKPGTLDFVQLQRLTRG
jgi:hypothetical protein